MRAWSLPCSWLKRTVLLLTAVNSFTGTFTSPKLMRPVHSALAMERSLTAKRGPSNQAGRIASGHAMSVKQNASSARLGEYRRKRALKETPEPGPEAEVEAKPGAGGDPGLAEARF